MNITEIDEAIPIRLRPFSKTSHIVAWLTLRHGRVVTLIKGACRPKSPFLGQYDLGYTCELVYYAREKMGLHVAKECSALKTRMGFRALWRSALWLSYASCLLDRIAVAAQGQQELFHLAERAMDEAERRPADENLMLWFEMQTLGAAGFSPRLESCLGCGASIATDSKILFSPSRGGILCPACERGSDGLAMPISVATLKFLRLCQRSKTPPSSRAAYFETAHIYEASAVLKRLMDYHLDISPEHRYTCLQLLGSGTQ